MNLPISSRVHGGPDSSGAPLHDFSTNSNGCGPCPEALAFVQAADPARYPDPAYAQLRARLAAFHGVAPGRIVLAASGSEFIFRFTAWAMQQGVRSVSLPRHGYGDYAQAAQAWGLERMSQPGQADLAWACDPSSPLGAPHAGLDDLPTNHRLVVLDRAYEPLRLSGALTLEPRSLDGFWQIWTPNKALGLTGVRAAYAIAPAGAGPDAIAQLEALAPSWPMGGHGVAMLLAWCEPAVRQWLAESRERLRAWKERQLILCESLGWTCLPGHANFLVARVASAANLTGVSVRLRGHGIKLRDCASFGLPGHVRLSVQSPAAQDALRHAWEASA
jgi:histidinol-phosphate aminotransferase